MGFDKVGTPTPVTSVTANCKCGLCLKEASCMLREGEYVCSDCVAASAQEPPSAIKQGDDNGKEGQDGVS